MIGQSATYEPLGCWLDESFRLLRKKGIGWLDVPFGLSNILDSSGGGEDDSVSSTMPSRPDCFFKKRNESPSP